MTISPIFLLSLALTLSILFLPPAAASPCPSISPPLSNVNPEAFHQCLNRPENSTSTGIPFSTIYSPAINTTSFNILLNSTAQNLRCLASSVPKPLLIFTPLDETHVPPAVRCASAFRLDLRVRSGGHDYEGLSYISLIKQSQFVVLDLQRLRAVEVNVGARTAWVQAGATTGELYYKVANISRGALAFPAGLYMSVGIGGHITGGAYGAMMRAHGLGVDNVLDARMVMADGRVISNVSVWDKDLFWAIRGGGGGNFGIILAWKLRLVPVAPKVTAFNAARALDKKGIQILDTWQRVAHRMDNRAFIRVLVQQITTGGDPLSVYNAVFLGTMDELFRVMRTSFPDLGLNRSEAMEMTWIESMVFTGGYPNGTEPEYLLTGMPAFVNAFKAKSDFPAGNIPVEGLWKLRDFHTQNFSLLTILNPFGGVMANVGERDTAYPHRKAQGMIQYVVTWTDASPETQSGS